MRHFHTPEHTAKATAAHPQTANPQPVGQDVFCLAHTSFLQVGDCTLKTKQNKLPSVLASLMKPQAPAVSGKCFHRATEVLRVRRAPHTSPLPEVTPCHSSSSALSHLAQ